MLTYALLSYAINPRDLEAQRGPRVQRMLQGGKVRSETFKDTTEVSFILRKTHLRRTQAGLGRTVWLQQEQTSPNLERRI